MYALALAVALTAFTRSAAAADGTHMRLITDHGPVHVWKPAHYDADTAGIVVYVHGYFIDVDRAWRDHHLARQFAASGINALFIACEAPAAPDEDVRWTSVAALLVAVAERLDEPLPPGRLIAIGHSGAHRTLLSWLHEDAIDALILVDAVYGDIDRYAAWLAADPDRRLIDAAIDTRRWSDELHAAVPDTLLFTRFPPAEAGRLRGARQARVVYVHSQHDHMELVTGGIALPMLLRAVQLPMVAGASREEPLRGS
jgi:hypothetical protein